MHIAQDKLRKMQRTMKAYASYIQRIEPYSALVFTRGSGNEVCWVCSGKYSDHPTSPGTAWLNILCDGKLVKL